MPRPLNPAKLNVGGGLASGKTVEATAFVHPTQGLDGLIAHINDPSRAHMARGIGVEDVADNFASDHVEGALAELAGGSGATSQSGLIQGGTFTAAGLTVTLDPTIVFINGTLVGVGGQSIDVYDNSVTWLYIHATNKVLSRRELTPPPLALEDEHVLLWRIEAAGGVITIARDARLFVRNLDRKVAYTVRSEGAEANKNSEACFETLDAALLYLETFSTTAVSRKTRIIVRGANTISATHQIPIDDVVFEGEDGAAFLTGASLDPMFDVNGHNRVAFRNITFICDHTTSTAISDAGGVCEDLLVERCRFETGAESWETVVSLLQAGSPTKRFKMRDCVLEVSDTGVIVDRPDQCLVQDTEIHGPAGSGGRAVSWGIATSHSEGDSVVRGCLVDGFDEAVLLRLPRCRVVDSRILNCVKAVLVADEDCRVVGTDIHVDDTAGTVGIHVALGAVDCQISGCNILCTRTVWASEIPSGVWLQASDSRVTDTTITGFNNTTDNVGYGVRMGGLFANRFRVQGCRIRECHDGVISSGDSDWSVIDTSFRDITRHGVHSSGRSTAAAVSNCTFVSVGEAAIDFSEGVIRTTINGNTVSGSDLTQYGIRVVASVAGNRSRNVTISGNTIEAVQVAGIALHGDIRYGAVSGNVVDGFLIGAPANPTAIGIDARTLPNRVLGNLSVDGNTVTRCAEGIIVRGTLDDPIQNVGVIGNTVQFCGYAGSGSDTFGEAGSKGVGVEWGADVNVSDNNISEIGHIANNVNAVAFPTVGGPAVWSQGIYIRNCTRTSVQDNEIRNCVSEDVGTGNGYGITVEQHHPGVSGPFTFVAEHIKVQGNQVSWDPGVPGTGVGFEGIRVIVDTEVADVTVTTELHNLVVSDNVIRQAQDSTLLVQAGASATIKGVNVSNNQVSESANTGIQVATGDSVAVGAAVISDVSISGNQVTAQSTGIYLITNSVSSISEVRVHGNVIYDTEDAGIQVFGVVAGSTVEHVDVTGNTLRNTANFAASCISVAALDTLTIRQFRVSDNRIVEGGTSSPLSYGISFQHISGSLADLTICNNIFTVFVGNGIRISTSGIDNASLHRCLIADNQIRAQREGINLAIGGTVIDLLVAKNTVQNVGAGFRPFHLNLNRGVTAFQSYNNPIRIEGNVFSGGLGSRFRVAGGHKLQNVQVQQNQFMLASEEGLLLEVVGATVGTGPAVRDVAFSDNLFRDCGGAGLRLNLGDGAGAIDPCEGLSVTDNQFTLVSTTSATNEGLHVVARARLSNLLVSDNQFNRCGVTNDPANGPVHVLLGSPSGLAADNIVIQGNALRNCFGAGIIIHDNPVAASWELHNLVVTGNTIEDNENHAIIADLDQFTVVQGINISRNTVNDAQVGIRVTSPTAAPSWGGLHVDGNVIAGAGTGVLMFIDSDLVGASISGNLIRDTNAGILVQMSGVQMEDIQVNNNQVPEAVLYAIQVRCLAGGLVSNLSIDGNTASGGTATTGDGFIHVRLDAGGILANLSVCHNKVLNLGAAGSTGIRCELDAATVSQSLSVAGNIVSNVSGTGIYVGAGVARNFRVCGNDIRSIDDVGIHYEGAGPVQGLHITHNQTRLMDTGISIDQAGTAALVNVSDNHCYASFEQGIAATFQDTLRDCTMSRNQIEDAERGLSWSSTADARSVSITDNNLRDVVREGVIIGASPGGGTGVPLRNLTVSRNQIVGLAAPIVHFSLSITFTLREVRNLQVHGNQGHGGSVADYGLYLDFGHDLLESDVRGASFIGNTFRAYTNASVLVVGAGVDTPGSGWTDQQEGLVVGNIGQDRPGGGAQSDAFNSLTWQPPNTDVWAHNINH